MPTFRFEHNDGRVFRIEATDADAAQRVLAEAGLMEAGGDEPRGTAADIGVGGLRGLVAGVPDFARTMVGLGAQAPSPGVVGGPMGVSGVGSAAVRAADKFLPEDLGSRLTSLLGIPEPQSGAGRLSEAAGRGAAIGLATGPLFGASAVPAAIGGAAGETAATAVDESGGGVAAQIGAGTAADIVATGLSRNPARIAALSRRGTRAGRAAARVGAVDAGESVAPIAQRMQATRAQLAQEAERAWESVPNTLGGVPTIGMKKAIRKIMTERQISGDIPPFMKRIMDLPKEVNARQVRDILSAVSETQIKAASDPANFGNQAMIAGRFRDSVEAALDRAQKTAADADAVRALREARKATRRLKNFERFGTVEEQGRGAASKVGEVFLDPRRASEDPSEAITRIFSGRVAKPRAEARRLMAAAGDDIQSQRAVRRGFLDFILRQNEEARLADVAERVSPRGALTKLNRNFGAAREIFGDKGAEQLKRLLTKAQSSRSKSFATGRSAAVLRMVTGGGGVGMMSVSPEVGLGMLTGLGAEVAFNRYGPEAVRELAIESLTDPTLFKKLMGKAPRAAAKKERLAEDFLATLVRSGVRAGEADNLSAAGGER